MKLMNPMKKNKTANHHAAKAKYFSSIVISSPPFIHSKNPEPNLFTTDFFTTYSPGVSIAGTESVLLNQNT